MRILIVHNHYGGLSGESSIMEQHENVLKSNGHEVVKYTRSSLELNEIRFGKLLAFFSGLHNPYSVRGIEKVLRKFRPDVAHIHNLYPFFSPAILPVIRNAGIPIVMTVHNYRLFCPNGLLYNRFGICERCAGGKEWNCLLRNCEGSIPKSAGYALRNLFARITGAYRDNVSAFLCLTGFQKQKLVENGFPEERCYILPNFVDNRDSMPLIKDRNKAGFLFIGRLNRQKGADLIIKAAEQMQSISFTLIGAVDDNVVSVEQLPSNVRLLGVVSEQEKLREIRSALALVFCSRSYEGFPMVFLEAMQEGLPIIAPDLAGYPEIIRRGVNGWLFSPESPGDLGATVNMVHANPVEADRFGRNGKAIIDREYSSEIWYRQYIQIVTCLQTGTKRLRNFDRSGSEDRGRCLTAFRLDPHEI